MATSADGRGRRRLLIGVTVAALVAGAVFGVRWLQAGIERREALRLARDGAFADAEPALRRALERDPRDPEVIKALALGHLAADQPLEAEEFLESWCALSPGDAEPVRRRLDLCLRMKRLPSALEHARRLLELDPDNHALRLQAAQWALTTGSLDEAERHCRHGLEAQPGRREWLYLLASVHHRQGRNAEAAELVDRVYPTFPGAVLLRGQLHLEAGAPERAVPLLRQVLAQGSDEQRQTARYHLSLALARTGQADEAARLMAEVQARQALELLAKDSHKDNPELRLRAAEALLAAGQTAEALRLLDELLRQDPHHAAAHRLLASHYERQGQPERAAEHRRRAGPKP